jgi:hypothetical protein
MVAPDKPEPESIEATLAPRWPGLVVSSRTNTATCARFAVTGSTPSRLTHLQVLGQAPGISIDRPRRPPQINPDPQPPGRQLMPPKDGPFLLKYHRQRRSSATGETVPDKIARKI